MLLEESCATVDKPTETGNYAASVAYLGIALCNVVP